MLGQWDPGAQRDRAHVPHTSERVGPGASTLFLNLPLPLAQEAAWSRLHPDGPGPRQTEQPPPPALCTQGGSRRRRRPLVPSECQGDRENGTAGAWRHRHRSPRQPWASRLHLAARLGGPSTWGRCQGNGLFGFDPKLNDLFMVGNTKRRRMTVAT